MVTLAEVAAATGRKVDQVEREARQVGLTVRPDWAGRAALTVDEAKALASGQARRDFEHEQAWAQHQLATKAWVGGRTRAIADAAQRVRSAAGSRGSGIVSLKAREAAVEAGRQYEKQIPRPSFGAGIHSVGLEFTEVSA
jgi:hypothetical protein